MFSMYANHANQSIVNWFTLGMLIAVPIALFIIGIRGIRKDNPNDKRAGYSMLYLAGLVTAIGIAAAVYFIFFDRSGDATTVTTVTEAATTAAKAATEAATTAAASLITFPW